MIEWLYYTTLDLTLVLLLVMILRHPIRRFLGAHISYLLWLLPLLHIIIPVKFNRPELVTKYIQLPTGSDLIPVYTQPDQLSQTWVTAVFGMWLLGLVIWSALRIINGLQFKRLLNSQAESITDDQLKHLSLDAKRLQSTSIYLLQQPTGPMITGLFRNSIFLPKHFFTNYTTTEQQLMLQHELTHAKRLDLWAQLLAEIYRAVFWFNPLIHLAMRRFHEDQELACDYAVLKYADYNTRQAYGQALKKGLSAQLLPLSVTFFYHKHERFVMLSKHQNNTVMNLLGLFFTAAIAYLLLTQSMLVTGNKDTHIHGTLVSYEFNQIPLSTIVMLVSQTTATEEQITGLELINNTFITAQAENVHAYDFLDTVLKENHFKMSRQKQQWRISKL